MSEETLTKELADQGVIHVNIEKSKVMVFRNGGKISNADKLYYDSKLVETVDKFSYLGFIFYYNNKLVAEKHLADQGRKAAFVLCSKMNSLYLNTDPILSLIVILLVFYVMHQKSGAILKEKLSKEFMLIL